MKSCGHEIVAGAEDFICSRLVKCLLTMISTYSVSELEFLPRQWSPTFWRKDWSHGRQFSMDRRWGTDGSGGNSRDRER